MMASVESSAATFLKYCKGKDATAAHKYTTTHALKGLCGSSSPEMARTTEQATITATVTTSSMHIADLESNMLVTDDSLGAVCPLSNSAISSGPVVTNKSKNS